MATSSSSTVEMDEALYGALHAVIPLSSCPHLEKVAPLPAIGIDPDAVCSECDIGAEVWICLSCFKPNCGRHVHEHALYHALSFPDHPMALSLSDLSVWCYPCDAYVHNERCLPHKNHIHVKKFGEEAPI